MNFLLYNSKFWRRNWLTQVSPMPFWTLRLFPIERESVVFLKATFQHWSQFTRLQNLCTILYPENKNEPDTGSLCNMTHNVDLFKCGCWKDDPSLKELVHLISSLVTINFVIAPSVIVFRELLIAPIQHKTWFLAISQVIAWLMPITERELPSNQTLDKRLLVNILFLSFMRNLHFCKSCTTRKI